MCLQFFVAVLVLSSFVAQAQDSKIVPPLGRIAASILNDEGEPVGKANVCITIVSPGHSDFHCGLQTDEHGKVEIESVIGKVGVAANADFAGYWRADGKMPRLRTVTLSPEAPLAEATLDIGPRPGILNLSLKDKLTGAFVESATIHIGTVMRKLYEAGIGNFEILETSELRVPIPPATDVVLEVTAPGHKKWFYTDPATESKRTVRLESGEQRSISVDLEPEPEGGAKAE